MNAEQSSIKWAQGLKKTKQRMRVLFVLERAETPLAAVDIVLHLEKMDTPVSISTVYRVLDKFVEHGMLRKTKVLENGVTVFAVNDNIHRHYAVCLACHRIISLEECPIESFNQNLLTKDFHITGHQLQMYGFCAGCKPETGGV